MIRTLLIDPHHRVAGSIYRYSLGLGYLAEICGRYGPVSVVDFTVSRKPQSLAEFMEQEEEFLRSVAEMRSEHDVIGISTTMGAYSRAIRLSSVLKTASNYVLLGGSHPTILQQTAKWRDAPFVDSSWTVDAVVWSEAEQALPTMLESVDANSGIPRVAGISVRDGQTIWHASQRPSAFDLALAKPPRWDAFDLPAPRVAYLGCSRGCPYGCTFCDERFIFRRYVARPVDSVISEIRHNAEEYGIERYRIADSTLGAYPSIFELCEQLSRLPYDLRWVSYCRVNEASQRPSLMDAFARAGCQCVYFGFESGSDRLLDRADKRTTREQAYEAVQAAQSAGLAVKGSFILGLEGETAETIDETIRFARDLNLDVINWHILAPSHSDLVSEAAPLDVNWMKVCTDLPDDLLPALADRMGDDSRHLWAERHIGFRATTVPGNLGLHKCGLPYSVLVEGLNRAIDETKQNTEQEASFLI